MEAGCASHAVRSLAHAGAYRGAVADTTAHAKSGGSPEDRYGRFSVHAWILSPRYIATTVGTGSPDNSVQTLRPVASEVEYLGNKDTLRTDRAHSHAEGGANARPCSGPDALRTGLGARGSRLCRPEMKEPLPAS